MMKESYMLTDAMNWMQAADRALNRAATATNEVVITDMHLEAYGGEDLSTVKKGLKLLEGVGRAFITRAGVALSPQFIGEIEDKTRKAHGAAVLQALTELAQARGLTNGGEVPIHQISCFLQDWVDLQKGLRYLQVKYRSLSVNDTTVKFTNALWSRKTMVG